MVRSALERAVEVARRGEEATPAVAAPRELAPFLSFRHLTGPALATVRRVLDDDGGFRARVLASTEEAGLDAAGWLFLARPTGWSELLAAVAQGKVDAADGQEAEHRLKELQRRLEGVDRKLVHAEAEVARRAEEAEAAVEELTTVRRERRRAEDALAVAERRVEELEDKLAERDRRVQEAQGAREAREHELAETRRELAEVRAELDRRPPPPVPGEPRVDVGALREATSRLERAAATLARSVDAVVGQVPAPPVVLDEPSGSMPARTAVRLPGGVVDDSREGARLLFGRPAVVVLVDGYNVAKTAWPDDALEQQRTRLIRALDELATRTGAGVEIVFDGPEDAGPTGRQGTPSVVVRYSGGALADDVILDHIGEIPQDHPVVVVSNDREVRDGARARGANVIGSDTLILLFG